MDRSSLPRRDRSRSVVVALVLATPLALAPPPAGAASFRLSQGLPFSVVASPRLSPDGRYLLYLHDAVVAGAHELWSVPVAGGEPVRLSGLLPAGEFVRYFEISPDSDHVVYSAAQETAGQIELYSIPIDGPEGAWIRLSGDLPVGGAAYLPQISPDGARVVYLAHHPTTVDIDVWSVPIAGGTPIRLRPTVTLTGSAASDFVPPSITPDGARAVFVANFSDLDKWELWSARLDGVGGAVKINGPLVAGGEVRSAEISPDGARVVYRADQDLVGHVELFSVPIGGGSAVQLNGPLIANGDVDGFEIAGDGARIVYRADQQVDQAEEVYSVAITGGATVKLNGALVSGGEVLDYRIAPDGSRVVYRADQQVDGVPELYSVATTGGGAVKLNGALPAGGIVESFAIAPDSGRVVYLAEQQTDGISEVFSTPLAGGSRVRVSDTFVAGGDAEVFHVTADSDYVVYVADAVTDETFELFRGAIANAGVADVRISGALVAGGDVSQYGPYVLPHSNGRDVIYTGDQELDDRYDLYVGDSCLLCDGFEAGDAGRWD